VTVNALHPGFVATNIFAGNGPAGWLMRRSASLVAITPEQGARTTVYLATAPAVEGITGRYFVKGRPVPSSPASRDQAAARRLWQVSEELTGLAASPGL
jgi:NAD(P)-dependent dehydrogenase (short-subunit alcohol dehydrogenase family)